MSMVFVLFWVPKTTHRWTKILSYKIIQGESLDIGLGNHLNPRWSSKCTIFMTSFFTKGLFHIPREMLNFRSRWARKAKRIIAKQRTYLEYAIETIRDSICETFREEFLS